MIRRSAAANNQPPLNAGFLESLVGYNTRRALLAITPGFLSAMATFELGMANFSVLSLIQYNPGVTSRQLAAALSIQPPNLVGIIDELEARGLIERQPHPRDRRATGLHLRPDGAKLMRKAERAVRKAEQASAAVLSEREQQMLIHLLRKLYA